MADGYALALQKALVAALKADPACLALVGGRVYDEPPQDAIRPFLRIGGMQPRAVRSDCGRAANVTFGIEAASRPLASGRVEATRCADAVQVAIDGAALVVAGFQVVQLHWQTTTVAQDVDGKSYTAIIAFTVLLDG